MSAAWYAEVDPFCCELLKQRYPETPNLGDVGDESFVSRARELGPVDIIVGGSPCVAFSTAGKRKGFDDPRGNLTLRFFQIVGEIRPTYFVWENVPGVLSLDGGRTFGTILGEVARLGFRFAYRVCDAQHWNVPQRRRRVFLVGSLGTGDPREVLAIAEGEGRNPPTGGEAGSRTPRPVATGVGTVEASWAITPDAFDRNGEGKNETPGERSDLGIDDKVCQTVRAKRPSAVAIAFSCKDSGADAGPISPTLRTMNFDKSHLNGGGQVAVVTTGAVVVNNNAEETVDSLARCLRSGDRAAPSVAYQQPPPDVTDKVAFGGGNCSGPIDVATARSTSGERYDFDTDTFLVEKRVPSTDSTVYSFYPHSGLDQVAGKDVCVPITVGSTLQSVANPPGVAYDQHRKVPKPAEPRLVVRRLVPTEVEALMGLPRGYTAITYKGKPAADSHRYRACGNGLVTNVIAWVGKRLIAVHEGRDPDAE
jgi:DNA (cytosine-5)-methyltransferase 1